MANGEEIRKLGELARIAVSEEELPKFVAEIDAILGYVSALDQLEVSKGEPHLPYVNVFRPDEKPHKKGMYTEKLAEQFPAREGDLLSVKQIISHD
jgi:aspartyl/glutamyl-tRNA(Asn/Gln) amidotransferase C subunit